MQRGGMCSSLYWLEVGGGIGHKWGSGGVVKILWYLGLAQKEKMGRLMKADWQNLDYYRG